MAKDTQPSSSRASRGTALKIVLSVVAVTDTLSITDNRTGKSYEIAITDGTIRAPDLRQIKTGELDFGLMTYDPGFLNTSSCRSSITYIDGDNGILRYRGYPVDQLAENATYLEVAYLLINGELPTKAELDQFTQNVTHHTFVHENVRTFIDGFRYDAHPMGMLVATVSALSTFYPEAKHVLDGDIRRAQMVRLIAKMPTLAAWSYRHSMGMPFVYPNNEMSYSENFLYMMKRIAEPKFEVHPEIVRALDVLFILHADHEQIRTWPWPGRPQLSMARCTAARTKQSCACCERSAASATSPHSSRK